MTGIIKFFNARRGYGFLQPLIGDPGAAPVYFKTAIAKEDAPAAAFPKGAEVDFDLVRGEHGPQAANVKLRKLNGNSLRRESKTEVRA